MEYMTSEEVQQMFKIKPQTLHNWCCEGRIPYYKPGRMRLFKAEDIAAYIESRRVK